jgi:hypothetical protein
MQMQLEERKMRPQIERAGALPWIEAELSYLAPTGERPRTYTYEPPAGVPRSTAVNEPHTVKIADAPPLLARLSLDEQGFGYDSKTDGCALFAPHTAFADPTTPADAPPRESIELRALVFHFA